MFRFFCIAVALALAFPVVAHDVGLRGHRQLDALSVDSFELIAVGANPTVVATLSDAAVVTIDPSQQYNIKAVTSGAVQSVQFGYNGNLVRTESKPVWAFCGDKNNIYNACSNLMEGVHTVSATPYSETKGKGSPGESKTITFTLSASQQTQEPEATAAPSFEPSLTPTLAPSSEPTLDPPSLVPTADPTTAPTSEPSLEPTVEPTSEPTSQVTLEPTLAATVEPSSEPTPGSAVAATTEPSQGPSSGPTPEATPESGQGSAVQLSSVPSQVPTQQPHDFRVDSMELIEVGSNQVITTLVNHAVLIFDPNKKYNINAVTSGSVGSVQFSYNGLLARIENKAVWAFCGDKSNIFNPCKEFVEGVHTVTATPYAERGGKGSPGGSMTMRFILSATGETPAPSSTPSSQQSANPSSLLPSSPSSQQGSPPPTPQAATKSDEMIFCKQPKFVGSWQAAEQYPIPLAESQGGIIGSDFVIFSGFTNGVGQATNKNYALDMTDPNATWRSVADLPVSEGITHGAFAIVGNKFYM